MVCLQLIHKTVNVTFIQVEFRNRKWYTLFTACWQHNLFLLLYVFAGQIMYKELLPVNI